jgi:hypothetical protein
MDDYIDNYFGDLSQFDFTDNDINAENSYSGMYLVLWIGTNA